MRRSILTAALAGALTIPAAAQQSRPLGVPDQLSASKTASGIRITSERPGNRFSLELNGKSIQPLSSDAVVLLIDGKQIEISAISVGDDLAGKGADELLRIYEQWDLSHRTSGSWKEEKSSERTFSSADGSKCFSWKLTSASERPGMRLTVATMNGRFVIALAAMAADPASEREVGAYLESSLLSLRRIDESQPRAKSPAGQGPEMNVAQNVDLLEKLFGQPHRALMNNALITPKDTRLTNKISLDPKILILAARRAIDLEGPKASISTAIFDGRSAHAINLQAYSDTAGTFDYWDPWGKGSFLTSDNNRAGVDATPHPTKPRIWVLKASELERVIYAMTLPFEQVLRLNATVPLGAFGALGDRLSDATKTDLFTFFHLTRGTSTSDSHGHGVVAFAPSAPKFAPLAKVYMTVDSADRILRAHLLLARSFIDDPQNTVFARDFAKSFLRSAVARDDVPGLIPLANEIEMRDLHMTVLRSSEAPSLPAQPSGAYLVFKGTSPKFDKQLSRATLILRNSADFFEMTVDSEP
jgi:hypothetical protein